MAHELRRLPSADEHPSEIAFALTGLGGGNAFGAGFLQAALDCDVRPRIISCNSGMIYWTWRYLEALKLPPAERRGRLRGELASSIGSSLELLRNLRALARGVPGVCRWARKEYLKRFFTGSLFSPAATFPSALWNLLLPCQLLVPTRPQRDFDGMAAAFNGAGVGVCFNTFVAETGTEFLHVNDLARRMFAEARDRLQKEHGGLRRAHARPTSATPRRRSLPETFEAPIDEAAVKDALWLTLYGPHVSAGRDAFANRMDGAYARSVILRELTMARTVLIPRPVALGRATFPENDFERRDFETELWWNASYAPQVAAIEFVNRLIDNGKLSSERDGVEKIELVPIEIDVDRGFFTYFREDLDTFQRAYNASRAVFAELAAAGGAAA